MATDLDRFNEIRDEMFQLLDEATTIVHSIAGRGIEYERARSYWVAHIKAALGHPAYSAMYTMESTASELEAHDLPEREEDEDDEDE